MPQETLFPVITGEAYEGVSVSVRQMRDRRGVEVHAMTSTPSKGWATRWVGRMEGVECDYLPTMFESVCQAWAYGDRRDVTRAAARVLKAARLHRKSHEVL